MGTLLSCSFEAFMPNNPCSAMDILELTLNNSVSIKYYIVY